MTPSTISSAMLMAAGLGTRLAPFTQVATKALLPVMGVPVIQFAVDSLIDSGVRTIVANFHHDADRTREGLSKLEHPGAQFRMSDESQLLLGSAGGIVKALPELGDGPFFRVNADVLSDLDWQKLALRHHQLRAKWGVSLTLAVFSVGPSNASYPEIKVDPRSGLIQGIGPAAIGRPFFMGAAVLEQEALAEVPRSGPAEFVPLILEPAIRKKKAGAYLTSGTWFDIGSPALWRGTHLSLIQRFETGYPSFGSTHSIRRWVQRVEVNNFRMSERTWISCDTPLPIRASDWAAPCYWNGKGMQRDDAPRGMGPGTILYGRIEGQKVFGPGIGFGGQWVPLD